LRQCAHDVELDVLLQSTPPDAQNRRGAEPKPQRLEQNTAPDGLCGSEVRADLLEVEGHRFTTQERGLRGLARHSDVGAAGGFDEVGITVRWSIGSTALLHT
jgi:hypothetical protein